MKVVFTKNVNMKTMVSIKNEKEIVLMEQVGKIVAEFYEELEKEIKPGISTLELDSQAEKIMKKLGGIPAQKGYNPGIKGVPTFKHATCISVNDEVIHGVPVRDKIIKNGDLVSVDTVILKNGFNGDAARTFIVGGKTSKDAQRLVDVTKQAFFEGIKFAKPGFRIGDISHAIGEFVKENGYSVIREFEGHGIGREMHEEPEIPNFGKAGRGLRLEPGMTLAIEPMVIQGKPNILELEDGWTIVTEDGSLAAHYENTILITKNEPKILTL